MTIGINASIYNTLMNKNVLMYRLRKGATEETKESYIYSPLSFAVKILPSIGVFMKF